MHGLPARRRDFRWLDAALAGRMRFLRLDLPGFGDSPRDPERVAGVADLGAIVAEACERWGVQDAVAVGHSLGGAIALDAATRTDRIAAVALVNSSGPTQHRGAFPRLYGVMLRLVDLHPLSRALALALGKPVARRIGFSKRLSDDELIWAVRLAAAYEPERFREQLTGLGKPVFVAYAEDDPAVEMSVNRGILNCAQDARAMRFETGGHNLQSSRATPLADALVQWSESL